MNVNARLKELEIDLPTPAQAVANYVPYQQAGDLIYISGQLPLKEGKVIYQGKLGESVEIEDGQKAAQLCAINILAQLKMACDGDLTKVIQCVRLGGFVNCTPNFTDHPKVVNGASDFMVEVFGEQGRHARAAVGCASLPLGAAVEIEALFRVKN